ncbi:endonuclease MutS2 [Amedibacillus sp. YH-ame10]
MKIEIESLELNIVKEQFLKHCSFSLGKQRIRQLQPHFDALWVERELRRVKEAFDLVVRYGNLPFGGVHDIGGSIQDAMKDRMLSAADLRDIADGIRACEHVSKYFKASELETPYLKELIDSFSDHRGVASHIEACISVNQEVLDNASSELRTLRRSILTCNSDISHEVQRVISKNSSKLMDTITTIRNSRTCILVKISEKNSVDGLIHGESASGQTAYVEPRSLIILNNKLQSLRSQEQEEIERILYMLSQEVKGVGYELLGNLDTFALLDEIFAKALWAKEVDGCVAKLNTKDHHLYIEQARHPLIKQESVVRNTYEIKAPYHNLLITGSNTGGKTVTLKTIGLFVEMTLCGMPVAAEKALVPLFDSIYVDIGDDQSIQESLSTFSSHISKLANICKRASRNSIVLLDELGSGTDPREGEPLAVAILDDLRKSGAMIIATTHYSALKHYGSKNEDILLSSVEFDMEHMRPTYRYIEGVSGQSNAFEIARRYGLKESVLEKANQLKEESRSAADQAMDKLEATLLENQQVKDQMSERLADIKALQESLEKEKRKLENEKAHILQQAKLEAEKLLDQTKEEAQDILDSFKAINEETKPHEVTDLKTRLKGMQQDEEVDEESDEVFSVKDYVLIKQYHYYGEILSINKDKVCVLANGMKMNVTSKDITHAKRQVQKKSKKEYTSKSVKSISLECNVIGMRVGEALPVIDKYLDDAILCKAYTMRLIHGVGTGALRKGVHDYLKRNPRVESFVMGGQGEGGLGATVVTLKQKGK